MIMRPCYYCDRVRRRWNSMLSLDQVGFVDAMLNVTAKPDEMEQILAFNRGQAGRAA